MNITKAQMDILKELINIGVGNGADVLNTMLNSHITLQVPSVEILQPEELKEWMKKHGTERLASVNMSFKKDFSGIAELVFPPESASKLVAMLIKEETKSIDLDSIHAGALSEVGNIVLNAVIGSISNVLGLNLVYSVPVYTERDAGEPLLPNEMCFNTIIILAQTYFTVDSFKIQGNIILVLEVGFFDKLLAAIDNSEVSVRGNKS